MTRRSLAAAPLALSGVLPVLLLALAGCGTGSNGAAPAPTVTLTHTVTVTPTLAPVPTTSAPSPSTTPAPPTTQATQPTQPTQPTSQPPTTAPVDLSQPPGTFDAAMAHIAHATGSVSAKRFYTPSTNIYCSLRSQFFDAACELGDGGIEDTSYCGNGPAGTAIGRIELEHGTATPVCNSDTIRTPGGGTLAYGTVAQYPGSKAECLSETIGVTCVDTSTRSGFFLAKGKYLIFSHGG